MSSEPKTPHSSKDMWNRANVHLLPTALLAIVGVVISVGYGKIHGSGSDRSIALLGMVVFVCFATVFLRVLTDTIYKLISVHHLGPGRAAGIRFGTRLIGGAAIFITALDLAGVPVGKLLVGGAALGIILGVAAQQALANFFASIVLIISHPFSVGDDVTINSGGLGGAYIGKIKDIGLTHTQLVTVDGHYVLFPNAALLSGAAVISDKAKHP